MFYCFSLIPKKQKENAVLILRIENAKLEDNQQQTLPFMKKGLSVEQIRQIIKSAAKDSKIKGLVIQLYSQEIGFAQVDEIAKQLALFKAKKKPVYVFADTLGRENGLGTAAYLLASYADEIYVSSGGMVNFSGLVLSRYFLKSLLEHYSIKTTVERRDEYKGVLERFIMDEFSKPVRENMTGVLEDTVNTVMTEVAKNRKLSPEKVKELMNNCPLWGNDLVAEKLIDGVLYFDQDNPPESLKKLMQDTGSKFVSAKKYPLYPQDKQKDKVAVIYLSGEIVRHAPDMTPFEQPISDLWVQKLLNRVCKEKYKAVVLRVNSPGGDSLASVNIHNTVQQFRRKKIPVVMSMGNVCASAAYDMAAATDFIVAHPYTLTGSIGVAFMRPYLKDFAKKFHVNFDSIVIGENSTLFDLTHEVTEKQKARLHQMTDYQYNAFLQRVSDGRKIDKQKLRQDIAGGRVWSGKQAKELGLVDILGGTDTAVAKAADMAKLADYEVVALPAGGFADLIAELQDTGLSSMIISQITQQIIAMAEQNSKVTMKSELEFQL